MSIPGWLHSEAQTVANTPAHEEVWMCAGKTKES